MGQPQTAVEMLSMTEEMDCMEKILYLCKDNKLSVKMKVNRIPGILLFMALLSASCLFQGCGDPIPDEEQQKIDADPDYAAKSFLRKQYMDVYYFWRDEVKDRNATLKPYDYNIYDFFDRMLYREDRWSWMCDKEEYISEETGVISGTWGISLGQAYEYYNDYNLRVRYVWPGSPLERYGVTRGAQLTHINGVSVQEDETGFTNEKLQYFQKNYYKSPQNLTFRLKDGRDTTFTASMAQSLSTRTSLITRVFQPGDFPGLTEPVGYFLYMAFKANFLDDITEAMTTFRSAGVKKLIVDLRYNGGGDSRASQLLMDCLAPADAVGKPYVVRKHNSYLASLDKSFSDEENTSIVKSNENALRPDRIYFIVGPGSASASEMVINGLRPYMGDKLQMVGDTTYGKPNGMYVLMYPGSNDDYEAYVDGDFSKLQWVFLPIAFFNQNSAGEAIPYDGFIPDKYRPDDVFHDFGVEEENIRACLTHMVSGTWPAITRSSQAVSTKATPKTGYRIDREEDSPRYGLYKVLKGGF